MVARWPTPPHAQACPDFCRLALRCKKISTSGYPSRRPAQVLRRMNLVVSRRVQRLMASLLAIQAAAPASIERELSGSGISRSRTAALNVMDSLLKALQRAGPSTGFRGLKWGDSAAELAAVPIKCRMSHVLARSLALGQASRFSCRGERRGAGKHERPCCGWQHGPQKWLRGRDLNPRPLGYEPNELPDCSTPRQWCRTRRRRPLRLSNLPRAGGRVKSGARALAARRP